MKFEEIKNIVKLMSENDLTEFKIEAEDMHLCIRRGSANAAVVTAVPAVAAAPVAAAVAAAPKSRVTYILLGLFLGGLGIHNFYAGRSGAGVVQLLLTLFLSWLVFPIFIVGLWVLIELFVVKTDGKGVPFV